MGKDFIGALFREVNLGATQLGSQETVQHQSQLEGFLEAEAEGESPNRECRTPSLPDPWPLRCQLGLRCKGQGATKGGRLPAALRPAPNGRAEGTGVPGRRRDGQDVGPMNRQDVHLGELGGPGPEEGRGRGWVGTQAWAPRSHGNTLRERPPPGKPCPPSRCPGPLASRPGPSRSRPHSRPSVGLAPSWPGLLSEPAGRGKILPK